MDAGDNLSEKNEELKQRRYSLQLRIEAYKKNEEYLLEDLQVLNKDNEQALADRLLQERNKYKNNLSDFKIKRDILLQEIEHLTSRQKESKDKLKEFKKVKDNCRIDNEDLNEEKRCLEKSVELSRMKCEELKNEVEEKENELEWLKKNIKAMKERVEELYEIISFKNDRILELKNSIVTRKSEYEEIQMMIEKIQIEQVDEKKKGNCLFSELEDQKKKIARKVTLLKNICEKMNKQNEGFKYELRKKLNEIKEWNFRFGNDSMINQLNYDVLKSLADHKRLMEKVIHLKKNYPWISSIKETDAESPHHHLELLRNKLKIEHKKMDDRNFYLSAVKDEFRNISQIIKVLENDLEFEKCEYDKLIMSTDENKSVDSVEKASLVKSEKVHQVQFEITEKMEEKENDTNVAVVNKTKIKCQPVKIKKPVIETCEQQ